MVRFCHALRARYSIVHRPAHLPRRRRAGRTHADRTPRPRLARRMGLVPGRIARRRVPAGTRRCTRSRRRLGRLRRPSPGAPWRRLDPPGDGPRVHAARRGRDAGVAPRPRTALPSPPSARSHRNQWRSLADSGNRPDRGPGSRRVSDIRADGNGRRETDDAYCTSVRFPPCRDTATARPGVRFCGRRAARQAAGPLRAPPA